MISKMEGKGFTGACGESKNKHRQDQVSAKKELSKREEEIIAEVAKGLTNKEIAEKLFISVHTVMTHRKNIAGKLQIHSPSGLTIYAILNNLVELDDVKK
jgi:DNA-binding NarL/FixJ family response regulator